MKKHFILLSILFSVLFVQAQNSQNEIDIVKIIDHLTIKWDEGAPMLETYEGFRKFCHTRAYRNETIDLLNKIHHYDTVLYFTVKRKYELNEDPEVASTLSDITIVEEKYTTKSFLEFLHRECRDINDTERNYSDNTDPEFIREKNAIEKELVKYVEVITERIDNVDEHVHHLKKLSERK